VEASRSFCEHTATGYLSNDFIARKASRAAAFGGERGPTEGNKVRMKEQNEL
jgi:hypothetical protein